MSEWNGPICCMCDGSGHLQICSETPIPATPFVVAERNLETDLICPACNGHGRDAE